MTFLAPLALLGLLLVPVLILIDRLHRRPRERVWPSLLLWEGVLEGEAATRRRRDPLLLYECAAVALLSLAAAGPAFRAGTSLRVIVLQDAGPHMGARRDDGRTASGATQAEVERIYAALGSNASVKSFPVERDLARAAAALPDADLRVVATNRPLAAPGVRVVGRKADGVNLGIDAVFVDGDTLWFAVATDGPPATVTVRAGGERDLEVRTGEGVSIPFVRGLEILTPDNLDVDDAVSLRRPTLEARNETGSRLVDAALFEAGTKAHRAGGGLVVTGRGGAALSGVVRGTDCIAGPGLFEGLLLDECRWRDVRARDGEGLLTYDGKALAQWLSPDTLWLGLPVDREWDDHGTLAVLLERAKRARVPLGPVDVVVGDAIASPPPGLVDTRGVDRPWDGVLPEGRPRTAGRVGLRVALAMAAAVVLALYARAIVQRR